MSPSSLDNPHIDEIAALLAVASEGSFVAAGRLLQRHPSILTKRLAAMEERLGVRLLERSTRQVRMTEVGSQLVERLRSAVDLISDAEQEASVGAAEARGVLRVSLPAAMGRIWLGPMIPEFLAAHPHISIVADYSDRYVDIIAEGFDAAIRIGELNDSRLVARRLCHHRRILCASPDYIELHGLPSTPQELAGHSCLRFSGFSSFPEWHLANGDQRERVLPKGTLTSNDSQALLSAALAGAGILGGGEWLMSREIAASRLIRVLPDWLLDVEGGVFLVRPSSKFPPAAATAFKDWLVSKFAEGPPWANYAE